LLTLFILIQVKSIIFKLIELTVAEKDFYPSVQIKIWGNLGKMGALIDPILESFIETCSQGGLGSFKVIVSQIHYLFKLCCPSNFFNSTKKLHI